MRGHQVGIYVAPKGFVHASSHDESEPMFVQLVEQAMC